MIHALHRLAVERTAITHDNLTSQERCEIDDWKAKRLAQFNEPKGMRRRTDTPVTVVPRLRWPQQKLWRKRAKA